MKNLEKTAVAEAKNGAAKTNKYDRLVNKKRKITENETSENSGKYLAYLNNIFKLIERNSL